jgi:hypothetical protein
VLKNKPWKVRLNNLPLLLRTGSVLFVLVFQVPLVKYFPEQTAGLEAAKYIFRRFMQVNLGLLRVYLINISLQFKGLTRVLIYI